MLKIRFFRTGKKHQPSFKIVVVDRKNPPRGGRFVDEVGFWNPLNKEKKLKAEKIKRWLSKGAKCSDSVYNLFIREGVLEGKKRDVHKTSKKAKPLTTFSKNSKKEKDVHKTFKKEPKKEGEPKASKIAEPKTETI